METVSTAAASFSARYRRYLLVLLTVILAVNYADRLVFGVVLQDIKVDLKLSDTQLGVLSGIAFALFYAIMGLPLARWADRGNRIRIISLCTGLWSVAVAVCGAAGNFLQLALARMGVAVGEAGCYPPSMSLLSDHYPRAERPLAVSRYMLGLSFGLMLGYFAAGWLNELYGWRATFVYFGLPGLALALLTALTLKEPRKVQARSRGSVEQAVPDAPTLKEVITTLWAKRSFRHVFIFFSVWGFFGNGILQWQPAFFVRSHGLTTGELGTWFAVLYGVGGLFGTYLGGEWAARYAKNNEALQLKGVAIVYGALAGLMAAMYLAPTANLAFVATGISAVISGAANGPIFATIQTLVPTRMRAMAVALLYFFTNLIGLGLGPIGVGMLSDALQPAWGDESLRYALLAFCPGYLWCAWHGWTASRTVVQEIPLAERA